MNTTDRSAPRQFGAENPRADRDGMCYAQVPIEFIKTLPVGPLRVLTVLIGILRHRDSPTTGELAEAVGCSIGSVGRHLAALEQAGAITRRRCRGGRVIRLTYTLAGRKAPAPIARPEPGDDCTHRAPLNAPIARPVAIDPPDPPIKPSRNVQETLTLAHAEGGEQASVPATASPVPAATSVESSSSVDDEPDPTPEEIAEWERDQDLRGITGTIARSKLNIWRKKLEERAKPKPTPRPAAPAQPPAATSVQPPETTDAIRRLERDHSEAFARATAGRMARRLDDEGSEAFYLRICKQVQSGETPLAPVLRAFKSASGSDTARNKAACFVGLLRRAAGR